MGVDGVSSLQSPPSNISKTPAFLKKDGGTSKMDTKPWSSYTPADYTVAQYHAAALIHNHDGPPTSKNDCKLPIKTPDGVVNKQAVFSATAVLAGARGGVQASAQQKASAAKQLITQYNKMNSEPPPSLKKLAHSIDVGKFIEHHGIKGQKWGIRNPRNRSSSGKNAPAHTLSDEEIQKHIKRMELEKRYNELSGSKKSSGKKFVSELGKNAAKAAVGTAVSLSVGKALKTALG